MTRNIQFQVLRGIDVNLQEAMPLALGEMYFATDTGNLYFGTPGSGQGYVQIGDITALQSQVESLLLRLRAIEMAFLELGIDVKEYEEI